MTAKVSAHSHSTHDSNAFQESHQVDEELIRRAERVSLSMGRSIRPLRMKLKQSIRPDRGLSEGSRYRTIQEASL